MKKLLVIISITIMSLALTGCGGGGNTDNGTEKISNKNVTVYIDPDTGVNYLVFSAYRTSSITVRVDAEGKPIVNK